MGAPKRGYIDRIVSFDPLSQAFNDLEAAARDDPLWDVLHVGLAAVPGEADINAAPRPVAQLAAAHG